MSFIVVKCPKDKLGPVISYVLAGPEVADGTWLTSDYAHVQ